MSDEAMNLESNEGFIVDTDIRAEWALKKLSKEKAEFQRLKDVCQEAIEQYKAMIEQYEQEEEKKTAYLRMQLEQFFQSVPHRKTKTQESYRLPSGTLYLKRKPPEFVRDDEKLLKYLKVVNEDKYIKVKETVDWAEYKKTLKISGEAMIDSDGVIVEGIKVVERPPEFVIEI